LSAHTLIQELDRPHLAAAHVDFFAETGDNLTVAVEDLDLGVSSV